MKDFIPASLVIVTPVYEDVEASNMLFMELRKELGSQIYIVAVDDGSVRQPLDIESMKTANVDGVVIKLKRNVGHQRAIAIGLNYVADQIPNATQVVIMDSDGEDLPATIPNLLLRLSSSEVDIVVAQRKTRVETLRFLVFYKVYKWLFKIMSGRTISFGNFMVLKPPALKRMVAMQELWTHLAGCVLSSKLRIATCPLDRGPRYAGQSKMNFVSLALHGFKGMMVFAEDVLVRVGIACAGVAALSVIFSIIAIGLKLFSYATPGWFSVALGLLFLVFLQTGALTLMTLMLTGVMRSGIVDKPDYIQFIENLNYANAANRNRA
jgi:glycosyltransferase involved in cell wall biosynthesis